MRAKTIAYFFIYFLLLGGCTLGQNNKEGYTYEELTDQLKKTERYVSRKTYIDDSLYFYKVIRTNIDSGIPGPFQNYYLLYDKAKYRDSIGIFVDEVFYSPDSSKVFVFLILKTPNKYEKERGMEDVDSVRKRQIAAQPWSFDVTTLIGFRKNSNEPWYLYHLGKKQFVGYSHYIEVKAAISNYYLNYSEVRAFEPELKPKYDLDNPNFWNDVLFRRDNNIVGFYDFQAHCYIKNVDEWTCEFNDLLNGIRGNAINSEKFPPTVTFFKDGGTLKGY